TLRVVAKVRAHPPACRWRRPNPRGILSFPYARPPRRFRSRRLYARAVLGLSEILPIAQQAPLIPAQAGIQDELGPRFRGDEREESLETPRCPSCSADVSSPAACTRSPPISSVRRCCSR